MELSKTGEAAPPKQRHAPLALLIVAMLLIGPLLVTIGSVLVAGNNHLLATGTRVAGTVIDVHDGPESSDRRFGAEYFAADSSRHVIWADWVSHAKPKLRDTVTVVYRQDDPGSAVIAGYGTPGEFVQGLGIVLTVIVGGTGVVMLVSGRRGNRKRSRERL
ncbi:DUF3592 domain-containing protein [Curtobacterium herbarum]|uniref:DUF3592 domain-containing protein n=1 Tax=Curtobacterium herbarum TaxID=150122 RepID=A0ABN1ZFZ1_9MICO|nr:DUF3592 domain-containing protein [Curtobacterium herbarum]MBM7474368.1 hypothetical protein [Curtobacterium herbarum]MCS6545754.1 DUF3592 domain-containing protein [Curtobacterium herbarum]